MNTAFEYDGVLNDYKAQTVLKHCGRTVLDVGCNTGELVEFLFKQGISVKGIDIMANDSRFCSQTSLFEIIEHFETVVCWNTLEHMEDDVKALNRMIRIATRNVILCVPRQDEISIPSGVTYRSYTDPTHKHYYTETILRQMIRPYIFSIQYATRCRPAKVYQVPFSGLIDWVLFKLSKDKNRFYADMIVVIEK